MKVLEFNEAGACEMATAYGTLKTRFLSVEFDICGVEGNMSIGELHAMLLHKWGFDLSDLIEMRVEPEIRRMQFFQKWWDRSERKSINDK